MHMHWFSVAPKPIINRQVIEWCQTIYKVQTKHSLVRWPKLLRKGFISAWNRSRASSLLRRVSKSRHDHEIDNINITSDLVTRTKRNHVQINLGSLENIRYCLEHSPCFLCRCRASRRLTDSLATRIQGWSAIVIIINFIADRLQISFQIHFTLNSHEISESSNSRILQ